MAEPTPPSLAPDPAVPKPRWCLLYFALTVFDLITAVFGLHLTFTLDLAATAPPVQATCTPFAPLPAFLTRAA